MQLLKKLKNLIKSIKGNTLEGENLKCLKWKFVVSPQNPLSEKFKQDIKEEILRKLYEFIPELSNENEAIKGMIEEYIEKHILQPFSYGYLEIEITKATISYLIVEDYPIKNLDKKHLIRKHIDEFKGTGFFVLPTVWSEESKKELMKNS